MDRRYEDRYPSDSIVQITTLPAPGTRYTGKLVNISTSGVAIATSVELVAGTAVQVEAADSFMFGFVVHSSQDGGEFRMGIEVQRVLLGGSDLSRLLQSALLDAMPETAETIGAGDPASPRTRTQ